MAVFEIGAHTYRSGKIDAMTQFHMVARLTPVVAAFVEAKQALSTAKASAEDAAADGEPAQGGDQAAKPAAPDAKGQLAAFAVPIARAIAGMSDGDREYIINKCFAVTHRRQGTEAAPAWAPLWSQSAKARAFDDINVFEMLMIAQQVIQDNLGGFFPGGATALSGAFAAASSSTP